MKILAFLIAVFFTINISSFQVSAATEVSIAEYTQELVDITKKYLNGEYTYDQYATNLHTLYNNSNGKVPENVLTNLSILITTFDNASYLSRDVVKAIVNSLVSTCEDKAKEWIDDFLNNNGIQGDPEFDLEGGSAGYRLYTTTLSDPVLRHAQTCISSGPIYLSKISTSPNTQSLMTIKQPFIIHYYYRDTGAFASTSEFQYDSSWIYLNTKSDRKYEFFGDIRYIDETPANDYITDNPTSAPTIDNLDDNDMLDLLKKLLENLSFEFPDLSNLEGLLSAILNKLGSLDSDNDTEILSQIYIAIQSLNNDSHDNTEIITLLQEIRDNISSGGEASDLTELTDELKDITKTLKYIAGIETIDVVTDSIDFSTIEFSPTETKFFDKYGQLINLIITKFGYGPVDVLIKSCQSLIFNTSAPGDLTFNYKGSEYTVLSTTMFEDDSVKQSLSLVKSFLSVIILLGWLLVMRKRIVNSE